MFTIATSAAHVGACLVLLPLFAFETLCATPAFHRENGGTLCCDRTHGNVPVRLPQQHF